MATVAAFMPWDKVDNGKTNGESRSDDLSIVMMQQCRPNGCEGGASR
jgi:hypothetical protein